MVEAAFVEGEQKIGQCGAILATNKRLISVENGFFRKRFKDLPYSELVSITSTVDRSEALFLLSLILILCGALLCWLNFLLIGCPLIAVGLFILASVLLMPKSLLFFLEQTANISTLK